MTGKINNEIVENDAKQVDDGKRSFLKLAAGAAAVAGSTAAMSGQARADSFSETAQRYVPPGQWPHHLGLEWYELPSEDPNVIEVWGYTDQFSYQSGDEVAFHVSTGAPTFDIKVYRDGASLDEVHSVEGVKGVRSPTPKEGYSVGCGWPVLYKWKLPPGLRSGFYLIVFSIMRGDERVEQEAGFCVRPASPKSKIAFMLATSTWMSYNDWGGGSYYGKPGALGGALGASEGEVGIVPRLHIHRPWARGFMRLPNSAVRWTTPAVPIRPKGQSITYPHFEFCLANGFSKWCMGAGWAAYDRHFAIWAENNGYEMDYITQHDLQANSDILKDYQCLVTVGHDEYYSWEMRESIEKWLEAGGHFARFGGNLQWQIRYEDEGRVQICYKGFARQNDPVKDDPANIRRMTNAWESQQVNWPGAQTFASSSTFGHLIGVGGAAPRTGGFTVYRSDHWMMENTDLYYGDSFAAEYVRFECDGIPYTIRDGLPYPTDEFGTPTNIEIVGLFPTLNREEDRDHSLTMAGQDYGDGVPKDIYDTDTITPEQREKLVRGCGILAYMPKGKGDVATAAVNEWIIGLGKDEFVDQITHNVLRRFTA